jgi:hypothetical protein
VMSVIRASVVAARNVFTVGPPDKAPIPLTLWNDAVWIVSELRSVAVAVYFGQNNSGLLPLCCTRSHPCAASTAFGEPGEPFRKLITAGERQPAPLHVEVIGLCGFSQSGLCQLLALLRTAQALADFSAEVLEDAALLHSGESTT